MFISSVFRFFFLLNLFFFVVVLSYFFIQIYSQNFNAAVADLDLMDKSKTLFERELELAAILQVPVTKRYGIVEIEEKPHKRYYRPEKELSNFIYEIRLNGCIEQKFPVIYSCLFQALQGDYFGNLTTALKKIYKNGKRNFKKEKKLEKNQQVNKMQNITNAHNYIKHLLSQSGYLRYHNRHLKGDNYKYVIRRFNAALKNYNKELYLVFEKTDHIHFLHEMLFIKNLRNYPFPTNWVSLVALHDNSPKFERILAAIRVVTEYDGDAAPEFEPDTEVNEDNELLLAMCKDFD
nr:hypothetical protein C03B1.6 - Caenorhabditis elegans [Caenorhabditis elegans]